MQKASNTIPASKARLCMMFTPNNGSADTNKGNIAQWIAQASDVVTPSASQFILNFIKTANILKKQRCCKIILISWPAD